MYVGVFGYNLNKRNHLAPSVISLVISLSNLNTLLGEYNKEKSTKENILKSSLAIIQKTVELIKTDKVLTFKNHF